MNEIADRPGAARRCSTRRSCRNLTANAEAAFSAAQAIATAKSLPEIAKLQSELRFRSLPHRRPNRLRNSSICRPGSRSTCSRRPNPQGASRSSPRCERLSQRAEIQTVTEFVAVFFVRLGTQRRRLRNLNRESSDIRPHKAGARAIYRAEDQGVSRLQDAISKSMVRRAHLPWQVVPKIWRSSGVSTQRGRYGHPSSDRRARPSHPKIATLRAIIPPQRIACQDRLLRYPQSGKVGPASVLSAPHCFVPALDVPFDGHHVPPPALNHPHACRLLTVDDFKVPAQSAFIRLLFRKYPAASDGAPKDDTLTPFIDFEEPVLNRTAGWVDF